MSFTLISASIASIFELKVSFIATPMITPQSMPIHNIMSIIMAIACRRPLCYALGQ